MDAVARSSLRSSNSARSWPADSGSIDVAEHLVERRPCHLHLVARSLDHRPFSCDGLAYPIVEELKGRVVAAGNDERGERGLL